MERHWCGKVRKILLLQSTRQFTVLSHPTILGNKLVLKVAVLKMPAIPTPIEH